MDEKQQDDKLEALLRSVNKQIATSEALSIGNSIAIDLSYQNLGDLSEDRIAFLMQFIVNSTQENNKTIHLNLNNNRLKSLPEGFEEMNLESLKVDNNELEILPFIPSLKYLSARNNNLTKVGNFNEVGNNQSLTEYIDVSGNKLNSWPDKIKTQLPSLKALDISANEFQNLLPAESIGGENTYEYLFKKLLVFNFSHNKGLDKDDINEMQDACQSLDGFLYTDLLPFPFGNPVALRAMFNQSETLLPVKDELSRKDQLDSFIKQVEEKKAEVLRKEVVFVLVNELKKNLEALKSDESSIGIEEAIDDYSTQLNQIISQLEKSLSLTINLIMLRESIYNIKNSSSLIEDSGFNILLAYLKSYNNQEVLEDVEKIKLDFESRLSEVETNNEIGSDKFNQALESLKSDTQLKINEVIERLKTQKLGIRALTELKPIIGEFEEKVYNSDSTISITGFLERQQELVDRLVDPKLMEAAREELEKFYDQTIEASVVEVNKIKEEMARIVTSYDQKVKESHSEVSEALDNLLKDIFNREMKAMEENMKAMEVRLDSIIDDYRNTEGPDQGKRGPSRGTSALPSHDTLDGFLSPRLRKMRSTRIFGRSTPTVKRNADTSKTYGHPL